ncbi:MAG TPA: nucleotidyl transferase [Elusimicrobia bacterium]|nr:nucleotidyl transferase [Elusimicrobiota bacterium]HBT62117.1 nucleotidyl transferase [Elusimicrobiota bacterium]
MIALILIGGVGSRLRPFTCDFPKPLLPVVNRPFLEYQFDVLKSHGVREVLLCTAYKPDIFHRMLGDGRRLGMRLRYIHETRPLGTGGAVKNAQKYLRSTVLILNGDVLHTLDVSAFLRFHRAKRAEASIALTRVKDPTLYGLVETDEGGRIRKFLEKPSWDEIVTNTINAGAYLFEPRVLERVPPKIHYSLERALFPHMLEEEARLFGYVSGGYWIDIGTLEKYLQVHLDILGGAASFKLSSARRGLYLGRGVRLGRDLTFSEEPGKLVLGDRTRVGDFARFSRHVCVGPRCEIGKGAVLEDCVVLPDSLVGDGAVLRRCVVGPGCRIGAHAVLSPGTALAGGSKLRPYSQL